MNEKLSLMLGELSGSYVMKSQHLAEAKVRAGNNVSLPDEEESFELF